MGTAAFKYQIVVSNVSAVPVDAEGRQTPVYIDFPTRGAVSRLTMREEVAIFGALGDGAEGSLATLMVDVPSGTPVSRDSTVTIGGTENGWADGTYLVVAVQPTRLHVRLRVRERGLLR
jgi:hypothetical protein